MEHIDGVLGVLSLIFHAHRVMFSRHSEFVQSIDRTRQELKYLRTFLISTKIWDVVVILCDNSLLPDIEAAITEISNQRERLYTDGDFVDDSRLKIVALRPRIKEAYDYLLNHYSFELNSPLRSTKLWNSFCSSIRDNLRDVSKEKLLVKEQLKNLDWDVGSVGSFVRFVVKHFPIDHRATKEILTHLGSVLFRVAHLFYICWLNEMDEKASQEMIIMIHDVQKKLRPNTRELMETYLRALHHASNSCKSKRKTKEFAECFGKILVPIPYGRTQLEKDRCATLRREVNCLIIFLIDAPYLSEKDMELLLIASAEVASDVQSLCFSLSETMTRETDLALYKLHEDMELLKVEIMLLKLLNQEVKYQLRLEGEKVVKDRINSLQNGMTLLGALLEELGAKESHELIWLQMEALSKEASSICLSFHRNEIDKGSVGAGLYNLLDKIKLFKLGTFLLELLNSSSDSMVPLRDQIQTLYDHLVFIRTFLMSCLDENGKQILSHVQSVSREAAAFYCTFHASKLTEELVSKMNFSLSDLLEDVMIAKVEISEIYQQVRSSFRSNFPETNGLGFLDLFLGNLEDLKNSNAFCSETKQNYNARYLFFVKNHFDFIYNEMKILRSFFKEIVEQFDGHLELKKHGLQIMNMAYELEYLVDSFLVNDGVVWYHFIWLPDIIEQVKLIKDQVSVIFEKEEHDLGLVNVSLTLRNTTLLASTPTLDEHLLDLPDQAELVVNRLKGGSLQRDVVSIVGVPGIGKTNLARKLYTEASVIYHFDIRTWCSIFQIYEKRKFLTDILTDINDQHVDNFLEMSEEDLELELYQCLKGKRYLIVMDDMWSIQALNDLEQSLPDDRNGSRILMISCLEEVALSADSSPHHLRLLTDDESWVLLQKKVFRTDDCPDELLEVGKQIAAGCKGMPLAVVIIAGLLHRMSKAEDWWKQVAYNLNSVIAGDQQARCVHILKLSYMHLPDHLKSCFLYLGAFVDDKVIPVRKLKWLWISEGFIQNTSPESLEDVAEDYLMDLIDRSLVMVAYGRSIGNGVKACSVHNIFRDFCLARCREEKFLQLNNRYDELFPPCELDYGVDVGSYPLNSITYEGRRLSVCSKRKHFVSLRPSGPFVRSLLFSATSDMYPRCPYDVSFVSSNFKLLRVLDFECINMGHHFPKEIEFLIHLWYLSLSGDIDFVPSSIANLRNLVIFVLKGLKSEVKLPDAIWRMERLRHIHVNCHTACSLPNDMLEGSYQLGNLVTFASPSLSKGRDSERLMRMLPKLRRLRCIFSASTEDYRTCNEFPALDFLTELKSLNIFYTGRIPCPSEFQLPLNLKKLTLSNFRLPWDLLSQIGRLPSLEVLKLLSRAFEGKIWEMREGDFLKLKFLKLDTLNIVLWNASSDHLPMLEHLVVQSCKHLEKVPPDFANIPSLRMIELKSCRNSAEESIRKLEMGIQGLKVVINHNVGI